MNPLILIPARMHATRLPGKPLADIAGKPMIIHVWERAVQAHAGFVAVATDHADIKAAVEAAGGKAVMTRADHPSGSDRIWEALNALDSSGAYDTIINLQGDMPTIDPAIISTVLAPLKNSAVDIATLAAEIRDASEKTDPAVVKVAFATQQDDRWQMTDDKKNLSSDIRHPSSGKALYFSRTTIPHGDGPVYHHIGIYVYRRESLQRFVNLPPSPLEQREKLEQLRALEAGMRIDVSVVDTVPLGVDTSETLEKARKHYAQR